MLLISQIDVDKTLGADCSTRLGNSIVPALPVNKFNANPLQKRLEFFAPADEKYPTETLTKIVLQIEIFPVLNNTKIVQNIFYQSEPAYLDNKDFKFTRFVVSPPEIVKNHFIESANGDNINKDGTFNFDQKGKISITYDTPTDRSTLVAAHYAVFNQNKTRVGSILIPTWLSVR